MADEIQSNINININTSGALESIKQLQNQISAFHTQMAKMGAANAAQAANMRQNLINSINAGGQFSANIVKIKTTAESFTESLEKNKLSLGEYFRYAGAASKTFGRFFQTEFDTINKVARERVKTLATQYVKLGRDANGAMQAIKIRPLMLDMDSFATKTAITAQRQQLLNQLLKQGSTNLLNFGKNTQWAGRQLMVGFTIPLTIMGGAAMKAFQQMEEAAIKFKRVYGDLNTTNAETERMLKNVQQLALEYTKYGVAVSKTMDMAAQAAATGKQGADLLAQVNNANKLAVLGGVEQGKALETTISLTNAFSVAAKDLKTNIDFLNAVENQTVLNIDDMTTAIPKAAPVVRQLGGDVKDLAFFLTAMKEGGINASEGANAIKSGLASLINPSAKASAMLQGFGINIKQIVEGDKGDLKKTVVDFAKALDTLDPLNRARAIEQLFGKFQFARMSTLFQNVIAQGSQAAEVLKLASASSLELSMLSQKELNKISESPLYKFQKAIADFQTQLAPIGEQFMRAVTPIIEFGTNIMKQFNGLGDGVKQFIVKVVSVVGIIGPVVLMSFGLIANAVANVIKGFALVKGIFNSAGKSSLSLGEQVKYMTTQQLEAAAVAASLDQTHSKLRQTFELEAGALNNLAGAYRRAVAAQEALNVPITPRGPIRRFATGGIFSGPGTGTSDSILAKVSNGEAIIPAASVARHPDLINQLISGNIPGFAKGTPQIVITRPKASAKSSSRNLQLSTDTAYDQSHFSGKTEMSANELLEYAKSQGDKQYLNAKAKLEREARVLLEETGRVMDYSTEIFQTYTNEVVNLSSDLNNKFGTSGTRSGKVSAKDIRKSLSQSGEFSHTQLAQTMKNLGASDEEIQQALSQVTKGIDSSLSKLGKGAKLSADELDKLIQSEYNKLSGTAQRARQEMSKTVGFLTKQKGYNSRLGIRGQDAYFDSNIEQRIATTERAIGKSRTIFAGKQFLITPAQAQAAGARDANIVASAWKTLQLSNKKAADELGKMVLQNKITKEQFVAKLKQELLSLGVSFKDIMVEFDRGITQSAEIQSPSRKTKRRGQQMVEGLDEGLQAGKQKARTSGRQIGEQVAIGAAEATVLAGVSSTQSRKQSSKSSQSSGGGQSIFVMPGNFDTPAPGISKQPIGPNLNRTQKAGLWLMNRPPSQGKMFGASMVMGLASSFLPAPLSEIAGAASMATGIAGMFPGAGSTIGKSLLNLGGKAGFAAAMRFIPYVGVAITAFQGFDALVVPLIRKNANSFNAIADTLKITQEKLDKVNSFFGTEIKLSGIRSAVIASGEQTKEQATIAQQFQKSQEFKDTYAESARQMKGLSDLEFKRAMQAMSTDLLGQGMVKEQVKAIIDAIAIEAGKQSVSIAPELFSIENPKARTLMNKNLSNIFKETSQYQKEFISQVNMAGGGDTTGLVSSAGTGQFDNIYGTKPIFMDPETIAKVKANAAELASYISALSGQYQNGTISTKEYNLQYEKLIEESKKYPDTSGIELLKAAFIELNPVIGKALEHLSSMNFAQVSQALNAGVTATEESLLILQYGTQKQRDAQSKLFEEARINLQAQYDKQRSIKNQISDIETKTKNIEKTEKGINDKYDKRISQLDKIKTLNDQISKSQQGQIDLAEALNRGDIGAAARAAENLQQTQIQNALDNQKTALEDARKAELSPLQASTDANTDAIDKLTKKLENVKIDVTVKSPKDSSGNSITQAITSKNFDYMSMSWENFFDTGPNGYWSNFFNPGVHGTNLQQWIQDHYVIVNGKMVPKPDIQNADGGYISGPGHGTSDSIPAMLSNGEYVIRANAVKTIGTDVLDRLNQADRMKFANGGMVGYADGGYIGPRPAPQWDDKGRWVVSRGESYWSTAEATLPADWEIGSWWNRILQSNIDPTTGKERRLYRNSRIWIPGRMEPYPPQNDKKWWTTAPWHTGKLQPSPLIPPQIRGTLPWHTGPRIDGGFGGMGSGNPESHVGQGGGGIGGGLFGFGPRFYANGGMVKGYKDGGNVSAPGNNNQNNSNQLNIKQFDSKDFIITGNKNAGVNWSRIATNRKTGQQYVLKNLGFSKDAIMHEAATSSLLRLFGINSVNLKVGKVGNKLINYSVFDKNWKSGSDYNDWRARNFVFTHSSSVPTLHSLSLTDTHLDNVGMSKGKIKLIDVGGALGYTPEGYYSKVSFTGNFGGADVSRYVNNSNDYFNFFHQIQHSPKFAKDALGKLKRLETASSDDIYNSIVKFVGPTEAARLAPIIKSRNSAISQATMHYIRKHYPGLLPTPTARGNSKLGPFGAFSGTSPVRMGGGLGGGGMLGNFGLMMSQLFAKGGLVKGYKNGGDVNNVDNALSNRWMSMGRYYQNNPNTPTVQQTMTQALMNDSAMHVLQYRYEKMLEKQANIQKAKDKKERNRLYKQGGARGFEAGFNSWVQDVFGEGTAGGYIAGNVGNYIAGDKLLDAALSTLSLPLNIIGSATYNTMGGVEALQKGDLNLLGNSILGGMRDPWVATYGHMYGIQDKTLFEKAANRVNYNKWFGTDNPENAALSRIIGASMNVAADPTTYIGAGLIGKIKNIKYAAAATKAGRVGRASIRDFFKTAQATRSAKNIFSAISENKQTARAMSKLTPAVGFNMHKQGLLKFLLEGEYKTVRHGVRSSTTDTILERQNIEDAMLGISKNASPSEFPAYGFLTSRESIPNTMGTTYPSVSGDTPMSQLARNAAMLKINPDSALLRQYGNYTVITKPGVLGRSHYSFGDTLSIWSAFKQLGLKIPKVSRMSSIFNKKIGLSSELDFIETTIRKQRKLNSIPYYSTPYVEVQIPGGFKTSEIEKILLRLDEPEKISEELAELQAHLEKMGLNNIRVEVSPGSKAIEDLMKKYNVSNGGELNKLGLIGIPKPKSPLESIKHFFNLKNTKLGQIIKLRNDEKITKILEKSENMPLSLYKRLLKNNRLPEAFLGNLATKKGPRVPRSLIKEQKTKAKEWEEKTRKEFSEYLPDADPSLIEKIAKLGSGVIKRSLSPIEMSKPSMLKDIDFFNVEGLQPSDIAVLQYFFEKNSLDKWQFKPDINWVGKDFGRQPNPFNIIFSPRAAVTHTNPIVDFLWRNGIIRTPKGLQSLFNAQRILKDKDALLPQLGIKPQIIYGNRSKYHAFVHSLSGLVSYKDLGNSFQKFLFGRTAKYKENSTMGPFSTYVASNTAKKGEGVFPHETKHIIDKILKLSEKNTWITTLLKEPNILNSVRNGIMEASARARESELLTLLGKPGIVRPYGAESMEEFLDALIKHESRHFQLNSDWYKTYISVIEKLQNPRVPIHTEIDMDNIKKVSGILEEFGFNSEFLKKGPINTGRQALAIIGRMMNNKLLNGEKSILSKQELKKYVLMIDSLLAKDMSQNVFQKLISRTKPDIIPVQPWGPWKQFATGGIVSPINVIKNGLTYPKMFANGGFAMGTDTVPAMLTPGEFVIKKSAVDRIGTATLNKINGYADGGLVGGTQTIGGDSVYNYSISVNVSSQANPDQIARAVMTQIKQIDNHRIRGNSF